MSKKERPELTAEEKKKANRLCIISAILGFVIPVIFGALSGYLNYIGMETVSAYALFPASFSLLAGLVLMIIVRAKYAGSLFGKLLMIIYIVVMAIGFIGCAYLLISCLNACTDPTW